MLMNMICIYIVTFILEIESEVMVHVQWKLANPNPETW